MQPTDSARGMVNTVKSIVTILLLVLSPMGALFAQTSIQDVSAAGSPLSLSGTPANVLGLNVSQKEILLYVVAFKAVSSGVSFSHAGVCLFLMPTSVHSCHILRQADRHFDHDFEAMLFATMLLDPRHDFLFADTADLPITILLHHIGALEVDFTVALVLLIRNIGIHVDLLNHRQYADDPLVILGHD
jgi:hypothetical protein